MKLHEEFKLYEDLWDDKDTEVGGIDHVMSDTCSYWLKVDNSTKK